MATIQAQDTARRALKRLMTSLSEDHYAAGWVIGLGPMLWARIVGDQLRARFDGVAPEDFTATFRGLASEDAADLRVLSEMAGGWWDWTDDAHEPVFFSLDEWNARYRAIREGGA